MSTTLTPLDAGREGLQVATLQVLIESKYLLTYLRYLALLTYLAYLVLAYHASHAIILGSFCHHVSIM